MKRQASMLTFLAGGKKRGREEEIAAKSDSSGRSGDEESPKASTSKQGSSVGSRSGRKFNSCWLEKYSWLVTEVDDSGVLRMYCKVCREGGEKNAFTKGCTDFQASALERHISRPKHKTAMEKTLQQRMMQGQVVMARQQQATKRTCLLRTVLYMAQSYQADSAFENLIELQKANGCSELQKGEIYKHRSTLSEMQESLATIVRQDQDRDIANSPFVGLMIDETVNITCHKKLIIYVRIVKNGSALTLFLGNYTVTAGTAECVFEKIEEILRDRNISVVKVIGLGSDGAAVMCGCESGVGVRLKNVSPFLTHTHCVAHRCALVASNSSKDEEKVNDLRLTVNAVFKFFKYSAARYERLRQLHAALSDDDFVSLKEPCSVRWLSLTKATESILLNWPSLVLELDEETARGNATAGGLLKKMKRYSFVVLAATLMDILPVMDKLNRFFQQDFISLSEIRPKVVETRQELFHLRANVGEKETEFRNSLQNNTFYKGQRLIDVNERAHTTTKTAFIDKLLGNLDRRFPTADLDVVSAFGKLFDVARYPPRGLDAYGHDALDVLIDKYSNAVGTVPAPVAADRLRATFKRFKDALSGLGNLSFAEACQHTIMDFNDRYPDYSALANIALSLPVSSVPCERGFSLQNAIKTPERSRLTDKKVDNLMLLSREAPAFNSAAADGFLQQAAGHFSAVRERRAQHF